MLCDFLSLMQRKQAKVRFIFRKRQQAPGHIERRGKNIGFTGIGANTTGSHAKCLFLLCIKGHFSYIEILAALWTGALQDQHPWVAKQVLLQRISFSESRYEMPIIKSRHGKNTQEKLPPIIFRLVSKNFE
jgi:hypothetical protein